jgi:hypothetical protein
MVMKRVEIKKSTRAGKKMMAIFYDGDKKIKTTHFGDTNYQHYTGGHLNEERRRNYIDRHRKSEEWGNYMSAGSLSLYILWTERTMDKAIANYKKRFNLK